MRKIIIRCLSVAALAFPVAAVASAPSPQPALQKYPPPIPPKEVRSTDVKTCPQGRRPCGDSCISLTASCNLPPAPKPPEPILLKPGEKPPKPVNPKTVRSTDVKTCPAQKKPCGDSCISATAGCFLDK